MNRAEAGHRQGRKIFGEMKQATLLKPVGADQKLTLTRQEGPSGDHLTQSLCSKQGQPQQVA